MKIGITSDHRGYDMKERLKERIIQYEIVDFGPNDSNSIDYPNYAFKLSEAVSKGDVKYGIAICGSGIGMSIACNKVKGIRCARVINSDDARITRIDNDANMIAFSSDIEFEKAVSIIITFLTTEFSDLERHQNRINKITRYENEC